MDPLSSGSPHDVLLSSITILVLLPPAIFSIADFFFHIFIPVVFPFYQPPPLLSSSTALPFSPYFQGFLLLLLPMSVSSWTARSGWGARAAAPEPSG